MRSPSLPLYVGALCLAAAASPAGQPAGASADAYAGSEVCRKCHPNVWMNFYRNPHFRSLAAAEHPPEAAGCEACHGPGRKHVNALGGKATIPFAFSLLDPQQAAGRCLSCHGRDLGRANIRRSPHTLAGVVCTGCHSIHRSPVQKYLLANAQREVCYSCHGPVRAQFSMPFKHRVNEGVMDCTDCHNPHGSPPPAWRMGIRPRLVNQVQPNEEACVRCHADKRGPFVFEHASVRIDGCETCHQPHGSMNARLLRRPAVFTVCLECHNGFGDFGRQGVGEVRQSPSHNMAQPQYQDCTLCHVRIHGSNADPRFLR